MHSSGIELQPLPLYSFSERPSTVEITLDEALTALWRMRGDVTLAAELLKVSSDRLRRRIGKSARLQALMRELDDRMVDRARSNLQHSLESEDDKERAWATRYALSSTNAVSRGWGPRPQEGSLVMQERTLVTWADGTVIAELGAAPAASSLEAGDADSGT